MGWNQIVKSSLDPSTTAVYWSGDEGALVPAASEGTRSKDGTPVTLYGCNQSSAQRWLIGDDGTLRSLGKCLDTAGGGSTNRTKIQLNTCNGSPEQQWRWNKKEDSGLGIFNVNSGCCLDVPDASTTNGTQLQLFDCHHIPAQSLRLP